VLKEFIFVSTSVVTRAKFEIKHITGRCFNCFAVLCSLYLCVNKYVVALFDQAKMYAGCITCFPVVSHCECADGTDRQTPDYYVTLSARCSQHSNLLFSMLIGMFGQFQLLTFTVMISLINIHIRNLG